MIAIIGKTPPPFGGVTIYVSRLIENLSNNGQNFCFVRLTLKNLVLSIHKLKGCSVVHLIASHPFVRFYYSILCVILGKKLIVTYTDNIGEFPNSFYNLVNNLSIRLAAVPTALNINSLNKGRIINNKTRLISSFIPPRIDDSDLNQLREYLGTFTNNYRYIFCTNASSYDIDKSGNEMYGITSLISIFNTISNFGLIISDPSGTYNNFIVKNKISLGSNIKLLSASDFSFIDVIKLANCMIRATTTDGDSLSIHEAIFLKKDVICSDCVSRPDICQLYPTYDHVSLLKIIKNYEPSIIHEEQITSQNGFNQILQIYNELKTNSGR